MATEKEYQDWIGALTGECERLHKALNDIRAEIGKSKTEHEMQLAENDIKGKLLVSHIYCDIVSIIDKYK